MKLIYILFEIVYFILYSLATVIMSFLFFAFSPYFFLIILEKDFDWLPKSLVNIVFDEERNAFYTMLSVFSGLAAMYTVVPIQIAVWYFVLGWMMFIPFIVPTFIYRTIEGLAIIIRWCFAKPTELPHVEA